MDSKDAQYGLPSGLLTGIYGAETSFGRNVRSSSAGARGPFQFMPATAQQYGLRNPDDFAQSADAAGRKMRDLGRYYQQDWDKAVAAYNYGQGNVDRAVKRHGANWRNGLPEETANYLPQVKNYAALYGGNG